MTEHAKELAMLEAMDTGKPLKQAEADMVATACYFEYYGAAADKVHGETIPFLTGFQVQTIREPFGVTGHIIPRGPTGAEKGVINADIKIEGVAIQPGDYIMGDMDGLVVLSAGEMDKYIEAAEARLILEVEWQQKLVEGKTVPEIFGVNAPVVKSR